MKIVFDTNFLMLPAKSRVDVFELVNAKYLNPEIIILDCVVQELNAVAKSSKIAKLALEVLSTKKHSIIKCASKKRLVDNKILDYCVRFFSCCTCT